MDSVANLIYQDYDTDEIGQKIPVEKKREIFCSEKSLRQNEFYSAGKSGIRASKVLTTPTINYENEELIEYEGEIYKIYRTYTVPESDEIELYLEERSGLDGEDD